MESIIISIACGFLGGIVRGLIGAYKARFRHEAFSPSYFSWTVIVSGAIGGFASAVLFSDYKVALLAGYAGLDVLENAVNLLKLREGRRIEKSLQNSK